MMGYVCTYSSRTRSNPGWWETAKNCTHRPMTCLNMFPNCRLTPPTPVSWAVLGCDDGNHNVQTNKQPEPTGLWLSPLPFRTRLFETPEDLENRPNIGKAKTFSTGHLLSIAPPTNRNLVLAHHYHQPRFGWRQVASLLVAGTNQESDRQANSRIMAKGRTGLYLEAWKFAVYLIIPIGASWYYSDPQRQRDAADYWRYIQYPANPNVGLKDQVEQMAKQQKQRQAYREQLELLQQQARKTVVTAPVPNQSSERTALVGDDGPADPTNQSAWFRWFWR